ncbi:Scr1 family TA system antitoxin-like transcriptional regulator [Streptomyces sp. NPDC088124]|uniref:DUF397 domain-containing protein n=1 Tax=Streptomyces sp. NPDC088124 TaxID=3154654 RepID=UPI003415D262
MRRSRNDGGIQPDGVAALAGVRAGPATERKRPWSRRTWPRPCGARWARSRTARRRSGQWCCGTWTKCCSRCTTCRRNVGRCTFARPRTPGRRGGGKATVRIRCRACCRPGRTPTRPPAGGRPSVGNPTTMRDQLVHVTEMAHNPKITVQVMPFACGAHPGIAAGPFQILGFPRPTDPGVVYVQHHAGASYLEAAGDRSAHSGFRAPGGTCAEPRRIDRHGARDCRGVHVRALNSMSVNQDPPIQPWRKSSYSGHEGACVEIADGVSDTVLVRDSKTPQGAILAFSSEEWGVYISGLRGDFLSRVAPGT